MNQNPRQLKRYLETKIEGLNWLERCPGTGDIAIIRTERSIYTDLLEVLLRAYPKLKEEQKTTPQ